MPEDTRTRIVYAVGGLILGGLLAFGAMRYFASAEDEERPPIIVKGGSLIFQSERAWQQVGGDWQPDQKNGRRTNGFSVSIQGPDTTCPLLSTTKELTLTFRDANGTEREFRISRKPRPGSGTDAPAVTGPDLIVDNSASSPTLTYGTHDQGAIIRVRFQAQGIGNVECVPQSLIVWHRD